MAEERFTIKPFTSSTGYIPWKAKITAYLRSKKLEKTLEDPPAPAAEAVIRTQFSEQDNTAKAIILNSLSLNQQQPLLWLSPNIETSGCQKVETSANT